MSCGPERCELIHLEVESSGPGQSRRPQLLEEAAENTWGDEASPDSQWWGKGWDSVFKTSLIYRFEKKNLFLNVLLSVSHSTPGSLCFPYPVKTPSQWPSLPRESQPRFMASCGLAERGVR